MQYFKSNRDGYNSTQILRIAQGSFKLYPRAAKVSNFEAQ